MDADSTIVLADDDGDGIAISEYVELYASFSDDFLKEVRARPLTASTNMLYSVGIPETPAGVAQMCQLAFTSALLFAVKKGFATLSPECYRTEEERQPILQEAVAGESDHYRVGQYL